MKRYSTPKVFSLLPASLEGVRVQLQPQAVVACFDQWTPCLRFAAMLCFAIYYLARLHMWCRRERAQSSEHPNDAGSRSRAKRHEPHWDDVLCASGLPFQKEIRLLFKASPTLNNEKSSEAFGRQVSALYRPRNMVRPSPLRPCDILECLARCNRMFSHPKLAAYKGPELDLNLQLPPLRGNILESTLAHDIWTGLEWHNGYSGFLRKLRGSCILPGVVEGAP